MIELPSSPLKAHGPRSPNFCLHSRSFYTPWISYTILKMGFIVELALEILAKAVLLECLANAKAPQPSFEVGTPSSYPPEGKAPRHFRDTPTNNRCLEDRPPRVERCRLRTHPQAVYLRCREGYYEFSAWTKCIPARREQGCNI